MKRLGCLFLAVVFCLVLIVSPVTAKGSSGSAGHSGNKGSAAVTSPNKSDKVSNVNSGKTTVKVDLSGGHKEAAQQRIQAKEENTVQKQFKDTQGHWASKSIEKVQQLGLIQGYDGNFNPEAAVTQAEAMVMAVNLTDLITTESDGTEPSSESEQTVSTTTDETTAGDEVTNEEEPVSDVPAWARNQARKASLAGIININRFHSEVQATRAQAAVMLAKALNLETVEVDQNAFTDSILISPEDMGYILALKEAGVISGTSGKFNPNSSITRAEMATMLAKVVENVEDDQTGETTTDSTGTDTQNTGTTTGGTGTATGGSTDTQTGDTTNTGSTTTLTGDTTTTGN